MKSLIKKFLKVAIILLFFSAFADVNAQLSKVQILDFENFEPLLNKSNDTVYVINFWATWCVPCVKELPDFEQLNATYADKNFKMILVSLDFKSALESRVIPFVAEKNIKAEVLLLHAPDANAWINKVNPSWSGAIPATVIYKNDFRLFHEGSYTYQELNTIVKPLINP